MLQFDLQFYEELTVAWVRTVKFISGAFFWPTGQLVSLFFVIADSAAGKICTAMIQTFLTLSSHCEIEDIFRANVLMRCMT